MSDSNLFHAFDLSASGLSAQRARLNVIAENLANAQTTRTPEGGPYRRRVLTVAEAGGASSDLFERLLNATRNASLGPARTSPKHLEPIDPIRFPNGRNAVTWNVAADETSPLRWEYEPGHPDANAEGYVAYPNVDVIKEMVDLMAASRAYEANVTVLGATKSMLRKALEI
ncbi:MAG: flagellar basal body rod protein FlgC [bacterium]|nr:flagellar basal body rod protein FlgC [Gemmatimonadota bacterium]